MRFEVLTDGPVTGEAVVLLHGYPQSARSWEPVLEWLDEHGYRGIAPNLRGYSPNANPPEASAYTMDQLVADVVGIADTAGLDRFHLVGHDWGGALAWAVAMRHPERLRTLTVLSTPHPAALVAAIRSSTQMLRSSYMGFFRIPRVPEALLSVGNFAQLGLTCRLSGMPKAAWERDRAQLRRVGLRGPLNWYRAAASTPKRLPRVTTPTMFIWGRHDLFLGRRAAELTARHVVGRYRFVELDAGHWIPERNHAELTEQLAEHLAGVPEGQGKGSAAEPRRRRRTKAGG